MLCLGLSLPASGADFYVAPNASGSGTGSLSNPWQLQTALNHPAAVHAGDTIWLRGGTYTGTFNSNLNGNSSAQIFVRQYEGERAKIDSNGSTNNPLSVSGSYTTFWGFEVTNSLTSRPHVDFSRPNGVTTAQSGSHPRIRFVNLIVHDTGSGFGFWKETFDSEIYGCLVYYNGNTQLDHGIYAQNQNGFKKVTDSIIFRNYGHGFHAYGSGSAFLDGMDLQGNTIYLNGLLSSGTAQRNVLIGGGSNVHNPTVKTNNLYYQPGGPNSAFKLGYGGGCTNAVVMDNYQAGNTEFEGCLPVTMTGNTFYGNISGFTQGQYPANTYYSSRPTGVRVQIRPNLYEAGRANITVYNWDLLPTVNVDLTGILGTGTAFEVRNAADFFGAPVLSGTYAGGSITLPMTGLSVASPIGFVAPNPTGPELNVFVVIPILGAPAPTATATNTPVPPTATRTPAKTATPVPPTPTKTFTPSSTPLPPTSTPTKTPTKTFTPVPPTSTPTKTFTPVPPTSTPTKTFTPVPPTNTPVPPTVTPTKTFTPVPPTNTAVPPTATNTAVPPTATPTRTNTPAPPTATPTGTVVPPTATATATAVPPTQTPTPTSTAAAPTQTPTAPPPTATPSSTPVPPTETPTPPAPTATSTPGGPTPTPTPTPPFGLYLEAEGATLIGAMSSSSDTQAYGGSYVSSSVPESGRVQWTVQVPTAGDYYVWARVLSPAPAADSFYAFANAGPEDVYDDAEGTWSPQWQWTVLNGRNGTGVPLAVDPRIVTLTAGANTFTFRGREAGSKVDRIFITKDANFVPTAGNTNSFLDVAPSNPFYDFVETLARNAITGGCGNGNYCPTAGVTRAQMAIFLLKSKYGSAYTPPPATGGVFGDVHPGDFAAAWIEELAEEGITAGCGQGKYCPDMIVSRAQMAVFLLRTLYGAGYVPPDPIGIFDDLDLNDPFTPWIEQLAAEGVTAGCGNGFYCPNAPNTREQMAVFLVKTFDLK